MRTNDAFYMEAGQQQVVESLREANEYLENLINYANAPIIVWDPQFNIKRFNHAFEVITGRSASEVLGKPLEILFPPEQVKASMQLIQKTLTGERWEIIEINIQHVNASVRTVLWNSATVFSADGKKPIATIAQGQDITERKRAEERLRENKERLDLALDSAGMGTFSWDVLDDSWKFGVNANRLLGADPATFKGTSEEFFSLIMQEDRVPAREAVDLAMLNGVDYEAEYRVIWPDGSIHNIMARGKFMHDVVSRPVRMIGVCWDITEKKRMEARDKASLLMLVNADKLVALGTLVAGIAHEINNPNMFIMLNASMLEKQLKQLEAVIEDSEELKSRLVQNMSIAEIKDDAILECGYVLEGSRRIKRIVEELSEFTKDKSMIVESVAINKVIGSAVTLTWNKIKHSTDNFNFLPGEDLPVLCGNAQKLEQVIINMITNACDALKNKKQALLLTTQYEKDSDSVVIKIRDEGEGMSPHVSSHVKDLFFTTKRDSGGTGLGVPISARVIEEHGGTLEYESAPEAGTTAIIRLPVRKG